MSLRANILISSRLASSAQLDLLRPIYRKTASYGHFGREAEGAYFTWERTDKAAALREAAGGAVGVAPSAEQGGAAATV